MSACARCGATDDKLKTQPCVGCERAVCSNCQGAEGSAYWNLSGKKGFGCADCLQKSVAFEGGPLSQGREFYARVQQVLLPDALGRVETLTGSTLKQAEQTVERLVGRLEAAILNQRTGARDDVDLVLKQVQANLHKTLMWVAIIIGLINLAGIVAAVFAAKALR